MSEAHDLHPALRTYLTDLPSVLAESRPGVFWEKELRPLRAYYDQVAELDADGVSTLLAAGGYAFEPLPDEISSSADDPHLAEAIEAAERASHTARGLTPEAFDVEGDDWQYIRALFFLRKEGLLQEYIDFLRPLRIRSTLAVSRHWYYARQISALAERTHGSKKLDLLEIGAGAGNLAYVLSLMGRVRSYCIVDLPEMLVHSAYTLQRFLDPAVRLEFGSPEKVGERGVYAFLPSTRAPEIAKKRFDALLNLNSFMEMDKDERDAYFKLVYRAGRPGALFYNVNRRQPRLATRDGGVWDNNPLLYPYRSDDEVLVWEEDPFQTVTRMKWGRLTSLAVTRASVIRPSDAPARSF